MNDNKTDINQGLEGSAAPPCSTDWVTWSHDQCDNCGGLAEIRTTAEEGYAYDGDEARCTECGMPGGICCDSESPAVIMWHDEPDCECEWCQSNVPTEPRHE